MIYSFLISVYRNYYLFENVSLLNIEAINNMFMVWSYFWITLARILAHLSFGKPKLPVDIAGIAIDLTFNLYASNKLKSLLKKIQQSYTFLKHFSNYSSEPWLVPNYYNRIFLIRIFTWDQDGPATWKICRIPLELKLKLEVTAT